MVNIFEISFEFVRNPCFLSYPLDEHMCVFENEAGEKQSDNEKRGAAPWAHVRVPVIRPENWSVYELRLGMRELERVRRETEAAMSLLVGATPESRDTTADIARSTGISNKEAKRRKRVADVVGKVKGALEKLASGSVSDEHIGALTPVADMPGAASLLDDAASTTPEEFANAVEQFRLSASCGEDMAKRQRARRALRFYAAPDGMIGLSGLLPPMEGTELKNRLAAIVDARWRADHPDRAATLGGHGGDTYEQRMADALLAMAGVVSDRAEKKSDSSYSSVSKSTGNAARSGSSDHPASDDSNVVPLRSNDSGSNDSHSSELQAVGSDQLSEDGQAPPVVPNDPDPPAAAQFTQVKTGKPAVVIIFDVDKWEARIAGGGPIPITESLLDQARNDLYYCFKNMAGEVLKFGRSRRDPSPVQRLVLVVRDERCLYPGCHAPPDRCDVHHTNEVVKDQGFTDVEVMGLFCKSHHRHIHVNDLMAIREPDGALTIKNRRTGAIEAQTTNLKRAA
jgi:Domain of unknown function (DUF222)